ncbi:alpha/beta hydrolase [Nonomuraea endophytica]|uniref:alpha/beta hydrolase n=1 Tax=Nonomuraea endophytica TaxID=714136 RepID=UPI0037C7EACF
MRSLAAAAIETTLRLFALRRFYTDPDLFAWALDRRQASWQEPAPPGRRFRGLPVRRLEHGYQIGDGGRNVLYVHGGGYMREIDNAQWSFVAKLVRRFGCTVTVPIYPLVPQASAPQILDLLAAAYATLPEPPVVIGDSAGGNMALGLAQLLRSRALPRPERLILLCPHLDCTMSNPAALALERYDPLVGVYGLAQASRMYAGPLALDDPLVSPIHADLTGLPPITLYTGTREILYPDCRLFRDRAERAGVKIDYHELRKMYHVWMMLPVPEAKPVLDHIGELLGDAFPAAAAR